MGCRAHSLAAPVALLLLVPLVHALSFDILGGTSKCVGEEIQKGVLVVGNYAVLGSSNPNADKTSVKVTSPYGELLHSADSVAKGQFGFTTKEQGNFMACFWIPGSAPGHTTTLELQWKTGVAAKDWEGIAKKEKISEIEVELRKLEETVRSIHQELIEMRDREAKMRDISETTNSRVANFGVLSLLVCISVAGWQATYLKGYFERKKLL